MGRDSGLELVSKQVPIWTQLQLAPAGSRCYTNLQGNDSKAQEPLRPRGRKRCKDGIGREHRSYSREMTAAWVKVVAERGEKQTDQGSRAHSEAALLSPAGFMTTAVIRTVDKYLVFLFGGTW